MKYQQSMVVVFLILCCACQKEHTDRIIIEGVVTDEISGQPVAGIRIKIDAIKSPSAMGILSDGKRETLAWATTDANGHYTAGIRVFKQAETLEFDLNPGVMQDGFVDRQTDVGLADFNAGSSNVLNFELSPTAYLNIQYKNVTPASDSDYFYLLWLYDANGWMKGIVKQENCGTVVMNEAGDWVGKDVCGTLTLQTPAERYTHLYWTVIKNGVNKEYQDSVFVKRGAQTSFVIHY